MIKLSIVLIAVLSTIPILHLYFSYEDFSLLYGLQFPNDAHSIFLLPGMVAYLFLRPLLTPQFILFGYNPLGYYSVSFLLWLAALASFYSFLRVLYPTNSRVAFIATVIMASGYLGIEALTWNVAGGQIHLAFIIFAFFALTRMLLYIESKKVSDFILMALVFFIAVYFFQFRSFLLFLWAPLIILFKTMEGKKLIAGKMYILIAVALFLLLALFSQSTRLVFGKVAHLNIDLGSLTHVFLTNIGNLFFPSDLVSLFAGLPQEKAITDFFVKNAFVFGLIALGGLIALPLYLLFRKNRSVYTASFFSLATLGSLFAIMAVISFTGQVPSVWPSSHRFYIVLLPFVSAYLAILIGLIRPKFQIPVILLIIGIHLWFSNYTIQLRWDSLSKHLKYFYTTIVSTVPSITKPSLFLVTLSRPYPPGPFVSGSDSGSAHYLAGFYKKKFDDFHLATSPLESVKLILDTKIALDDVYAFDYKRDDIVNETNDLRNILSSGKTTNLGKNLYGAEFNFINLLISASTPVFVKAHIENTLDPKLKPQKSLQGSISSPVYYFDLLFEQEDQRKRMSVYSPNIDMSDEHKLSNVIDGRYDTTWIPQTWVSDGANITINLGQIRKVEQVVWASSRSAPWQFRAPSEYEISTSLDGKNFKQVINVDNAGTLETGQFFTNKLNNEEIRYVRLTIKKTKGGWPPAIDEIEFFDKTLDKFLLENYYLVKNNPNDYFPNQAIAKRYYEEILEHKIPIEINWRTDQDGNYIKGQEKILFVEGLGTDKDYLLLIPKTGRVIKSLRIRSVAFPSQLTIKNIGLWQPSLQEFSLQKDLLNYQE